MKCSSIALPGGGTAIVCSSGTTRKRACVKCGASASRLCDWRTGHGKTCDAPICEGCATSPAPGKDLCPRHADTWAHHPRYQSRSTP